MPVPVGLFFCSRCRKDLPAERRAFLRLGVGTKTEASREIHRMAERGLRSSGDLCLRCAARSFGADLKLDFKYRQHPHEHSRKTRQSGRASEINHRDRCP